MTKPVLSWALFLPLLCLIAYSCYAEGDEGVEWLGNKGIVVVVGSPFIEMYVEPGRSYARFHAVEKNQRLRIFKSRAGWYQVESEDGKIGWVPRHALLNVYDTDGYPLDFSTPSWSEAQNPWQLGLLGSSFSGAQAYTVFTGYRFTPNNSIELRYTQAFGEFSNVKLGSLMVVHQLFPQWRYSPFFTMGAGLVKTYPDATLVAAEDEKDTAVSVGGGLIYYLNHKISARIEYNHHTILTTRDNNEEVDEWKAGFSVLF